MLFSRMHTAHVPCVHMPMAGLSCVSYVPCVSCVRFIATRPAPTPGRLRAGLRLSGSGPMLWTIPFRAGNPARFRAGNPARNRAPLERRVGPGPAPILRVFTCTCACADNRALRMRAHGLCLRGRASSVCARRTRAVPVALLLNGRSGQAGAGARFAIVNARTQEAVQATEVLAREFEFKLPSNGRSDQPARFRAGNRPGIALLANGGSGQGRPRFYACSRARELLRTTELCVYARTGFVYADARAPFARAAHEPCLSGAPLDPLRHC